MLAYESMTDVSLAYGNTAFPFTFDPTRFRVVVPHEGPPSGTEEHLIESPPLADLARGRRVLLIVSDLTRPTGTREFLPQLLGQLGGAAAVRFLFATGLHRPLDDGDKIAIVGEDVFRAYPMLDHEPEENNTKVGTTSLGNDVEIDEQVLRHDVIVLTGSIGFHYFAGYSGGRKSLLPGVASKESIQFNHLLVLNRNGPGRNPDVGVARLEGNPIHEDMVEAARLVDRRLFVHNTILDSARRVRKTFSGHWLEAHQRGARDYFDHHSVSLEGKRGLAIVSCGGFPRDINMIQATRPSNLPGTSSNPVERSFSWPSARKEQDTRASSRGSGIRTWMNSSGNYVRPTRSMARPLIRFFPSPGVFGSFVCPRSPISRFARWVWNLPPPSTLQWRLSVPTSPATYCPLEPKSCRRWKHRKGLRTRRQGELGERILPVFGPLERCLPAAITIDDSPVNSLGSNPVQYERGVA